MVWIIRFQSIIIACQTSLTGFVQKQDAELSCRHTLGLASLLVQTTDAESSDSKHILMNRHLENAVTRPRKVEDGERTEEKQKVDTE